MSDVFSSQFGANAILPGNAVGFRMTLESAFNKNTLSFRLIWCSWVVGEWGRQAHLWPRGDSLMLFRPALFMTLLFLCLACQPSPAQQTTSVPASIKPLSDPTALSAPAPTPTSIPTPTATTSPVPTPSIFPIERRVEPRTQVDVQLTKSPTPEVVHGSRMEETFYGRSAILLKKPNCCLPKGSTWRLSQSSKKSRA